jgi:putative restriction endonuclease
VAPAGATCPPEGRGPEDPNLDTIPLVPQSDLLDRFSGITVWKHGGERAPHKPLLILYALARLQRGEPRPIPFDDIEKDLSDLLQDFGPPRPPRPE